MSHIVKIQVTKEDIMLGEREDGNKCPVALALHRALGSSEVIIPCVDNDSIRYDSPDGTYYGDYDDKLSDFVSSFDSFEDVEPFEIEVEFNIYHPDYDEF